MLTKEENELITRVGPGTPAGELLRRYWLPISVAAELSDERPTKFVRILGEDLVLFQDKSGRIGLLADHCAHRGASLVYGRVEERGISCAYHGWLYDCEGNILETPPEKNDAILRNVKQQAYPVQTFVGLIWAYMGPLPAPVIPPYDIWVRKDGHHTLNVRPALDCNWFQIMENSADSPHLEILHQDTTGRSRRAVNTTRGFIDDVASYDYRVEPWGGLIKTRLYKNGIIDEHPLIFPNILRVGDRTQIRVPVDDTHTLHFAIGFEPTEDGSVVEQNEFPVKYDEPYKDPPDRSHPFTRHRVDFVQAQDYMVWETQGPIANRGGEHLSYGDRGVVLLRRLMQENIRKVQEGLDPLGVIRDPSIAIIDTNLDQSLEIERTGRPLGIGTATVEAPTASS